MDILKNIKETFWFLLVIFFQFFASILSYTDVGNYIDIWESWWLANKHLNALIFEPYITTTRYKYFSSSTCLPSLSVSPFLYVYVNIYSHIYKYAYMIIKYTYVYTCMYTNYTHTQVHIHTYQQESKKR